MNTLVEGENGIIPNPSLEPKHILFFYRVDCLGFVTQAQRATSNYKDRQDADKEIKDVRKQNYSNKSYAFVV